MRPFRIALLALHAAADPPCWSHELVRSADFGPPAAAAAAPRFFAMHKGGWRRLGRARAAPVRRALRHHEGALQSAGRRALAARRRVVVAPAARRESGCRVELPSPAQLAAALLGAPRARRRPRARARRGHLVPAAAVRELRLPPRARARERARARRRAPPAPSRSRRGARGAREAALVDGTRLAELALGPADAAARASRGCHGFNVSRYYERPPPRRGIRATTTWRSRASAPRAARAPPRRSSSRTSSGRGSTARASRGCSSARSGGGAAARRRGRSERPAVSRVRDARRARLRRGRRERRGRRAAAARGRALRARARGLRGSSSATRPRASPCRTAPERARSARRARRRCDVHPGMPGVPDDEADVLFGAILMHGLAGVHARGVTDFSCAGRCAAQHVVFVLSRPLQLARRHAALGLPRPQRRSKGTRALSPRARARLTARANSRGCSHPSLRRRARARRSSANAAPP